MFSEVDVYMEMYIYTVKQSYDDWNSPYLLFSKNLTQTPQGVVTHVLPYRSERFSQTWC